MRGIYLLELDGDTPADYEEEVQISLNALSGVATSLTMQLDAVVANKPIRTLVDSGSTHCFIAQDTEQHLGLSPTPRLGLTVGVANGDRVACIGLCPAIPLVIGDETFSIDFFVIALEGYEMVLGCQWLSKLGPILWDFGRLTMSFWRAYHRVQWSGVPATPTAHARSTNDLLQLLLAEFADIFEVPQGLPPPHACDHRIHLLPDTPPVAVRPYRYPQQLKDGIEKQRTEMLQQGIIRTSTSLVSSPVLLVWKKEDS
jgi:hypothetical protein